jgi:hypothetical protein
MKSYKGRTEHRFYSKKQQGKFNTSQYWAEPVHAYNPFSRQQAKPRVKYVKVRPSVQAAKDWSLDETKGDSDTQAPKRMYVKSADLPERSLNDILISKENLKEIISGRGTEEDGIRYFPKVQRKFTNIEGTIPLPSFT